jgi:Ca2+/Na+ antiporter
MSILLLLLLLVAGCCCLLNVPLSSLFVTDQLGWMFCFVLFCLWFCSLRQKTEKKQQQHTAVMKTERRKKQEGMRCVLQLPHHASITHDCLASIVNFIIVIVVESPYRTRNAWTLRNGSCHLGT